jgi:hypothetical protein
MKDAMCCSIRRNSDARAANELRKHFNRAIAILQPYPLSSGPFNKRRNLETATRLARLYLSRAEKILDEMP